MAILIKKQSADGSVVTTNFKTPATEAPLPFNLFTKADPEVVSHATAIVNAGLTALAEFKQTPSVVAHHLFTEALASSNDAPVTLPPWEENPQYTILVALAEFAANKFPKKTLSITHRTMPKHTYVVKEYDPDSGRAKLVGGFKGGTLKPVITEREADLYYPQWS